MTSAIAVLGKSGSGKTTVTKAILENLYNLYPTKSILLIDNDLSCELSYTFGMEVPETIQDIKCGKYKYKSKLPDKMEKHEFIEWAFQDIIVNLFDHVDLIVSGQVLAKNCLNIVQEQINDALSKLIKTYDIVIFDCEYDLEYLNQLVEYPIDVSLIVSDTSVSSIYSSAKIKSSSLKFATPGQIGIIINKVKNRKIPENISNILSEYDLDVLGILPYDESMMNNEISKRSEMVTASVKEVLFRLNMPQL